MEAFLLASIFIATPLGPGPVPHFNRTCDRLRIYDSKRDTSWILCIDGVYEFPNKKPPVDRSIPKTKQFTI